MAQNGDHRSGNQGYRMVKSETRREAETLIQSARSKLSICLFKSTAEMVVIQKCERETAETGRDLEICETFTALVPSARNYFLINGNCSISC